MKKVILLVPILIVIHGIIWAQSAKKSNEVNSQTEIKLERTIKLMNDSKPEEIEINIDKESDKFELKIYCTVGFGSVSIEIYDASGKKQGNFSVSTQLSTDKNERVDGQYSKSLTDPDPGAWKVKIIPDKAEGRISIQTSLTQK